MPRSVEQHRILTASLTTAHYAVLMACSRQPSSLHRRLAAAPAGAHHRPYAHPAGQTGCARSSGRCRTRTDRATYRHAAPPQPIILQSGQPPYVAITHFIGAGLIITADVFMDYRFGQGALLALLGVRRCWMASVPQARESSLMVPADQRRNGSSPYWTEEPAVQSTNGRPRLARK